MFADVTMRLRTGPPSVTQMLEKLRARSATGVTDKLAFGGLLANSWPVITLHISDHDVKFVLRLFDNSAA